METLYIDVYQIDNILDRIVDDKYTFIFVF